MNKLIIFLLLLSIYSCNKKSVSKEFSTERNNIKFFQIDYERLLQNTKQVQLSEIASDVNYIPLETNEECAIGNEPQYFFTDSLIFVNNTNHILKYARNGKFLGRIGISGRGPQEIDFIRTMSVIPEKNLIAIQKNSEPKLLYFSFDGSFIKSISIPRFYNLKVLTDGNYLCYESGFLGFEKFIFLLTNENGDTLSTVHNTDTWSSTSGRSLDIKFQFEPFYNFNNQLYFKSQYNDTVYGISSNKIEPCYFVNLGKYKLPPELRPEKVMLDPTKMQIFSKKAIKYYYCNSFESAGNIFLTTTNFKIPDIRYLIYNKKNKDGYMLIDQNKKSSGIVNDWDGGLDFWPKGNIGNKEMYMPVSIMEIKEVLDVGNSAKKFNSAKNTKLRELLSVMADTGNPIIMTVTLKY